MIESYTSYSHPILATVARLIEFGLGSFIIRENSFKPRSRQEKRIAIFPDNKQPANPINRIPSMIAFVQQFHGFLTTGHTPALTPIHRGRIIRRL